MTYVACLPGVGRPGARGGGFTPPYIIGTAWAIGSTQIVLAYRTVGLQTGATAVYRSPAWRRDGVCVYIYHCCPHVMSCAARKFFLLFF